MADSLVTEYIARDSAHDETVVIPGDYVKITRTNPVGAHPARWYKVLARLWVEANDGERVMPLLNISLDLVDLEMEKGLDMVLAAQ